MSAHSIVTAIEDELVALCRLRITGRADVDMATRDAHCRKARSLIRKLRPLIGTVEPHSFGSVGTSAKGVPFTVVRRSRGPRKVLSVAA